MKDESKPGDPYRKPEECAVIPEYATTTGVLIFCDDNIKNSGWTGWRATKSPDPKVPPGPYNWKLAFTSTERIQLKEYETEKKQSDIFFVAIIWTWKRED